MAVDRVLTALGMGRVQAMEQANLVLMLAMVLLVVGIR